METKHTAGPWRIGDAGRTIFGPPNGNPSPETIANVAKRCNAPIIRAAPELLAFAEAFRAWHAEHFEDFTPEVNAQLLCLANDAEAVITSARGEA